MNGYIGVNNVAKHIKTMYIGIDGLSRKVKKAYIGDSNGIARLWYTSGYTWNKYNCIETTTWTFRYNDRYVVKQKEYNVPLYSSVSANASLGFVFSGTISHDERSPSGYIGSASYYIYDDAWTWVDVSSARRGWYPTVGMGERGDATANTVYEKGEYIGQVTSDNISAYPSNGRASDGFWYVLIS